jgi:HK97 family phage major capsid protein
MKNELRSALAEADSLSRQSHLTKKNEARLGFLLSKIATLRAEAPKAHGVETRQYFRSLERRDNNMLAGSQTITYAQGPDGGYFVPNEFQKDVVLGMAQFDPLLDRDIVTLVESEGGSLRPYTVPGWDLSSYKFVKIGEGEQQAPQVPPETAGIILNGFKYKGSLSASLELDQDVFDSFIQRAQQAFAIGLARGIGEDLIDGDGTTGPQGILTGAVDSGVTSMAADALVADDFENIYFSVDRFYRSQPKCAWLMNDTVYQMVRKSVDSVNRPLLQVIGDEEMLLGKPVHVSPSLTSGHGAIVFGDLSHYVVRINKLAVRRSTQAEGFIEKGLALYTGIIRTDAKVIDPTGGDVAPIKYASILS